MDVRSWAGIHKRRMIALPLPHQVICISMLASIDKNLIWPMLNIHCISLLRVSSMNNLFMRFFNLYTLWKSNIDMESNHFLVGKLTLSMAIFHRYMICWSLPEGISHKIP